MKISEPSLSKAFNMKTAMSSGVTIGFEDLSLEQYDLITLIEEEERRLEAEEQRKQEQEMRRINP